jgi:hypothetical protein
LLRFLAADLCRDAWGCLPTWFATFFRRISERHYFFTFSFGTAKTDFSDWERLFWWLYMVSRPGLPDLSL